MALPKRFFKEAAYVPVEGGYTIHLDARPVRTPQGNALILPMRPLAEAIAAEWQAQEETIDPASMPLGGFANTAIDRVGVERPVVVANLLYFAETDLLCYRAEEPADLVARQHEQWQPLVDWAAEKMGVQLRITTGVLPVEQPAEAMEFFSEILNQLNDMELTAFSSLAAAAGSFILALAVSENHIDADQAGQLALMDECFQIERWGEDAEARARLQQLKADMASAELFLSLLRQ
jgi:chaperone required for assembly of F1-ATPase